MKGSCGPVSKVRRAFSLKIHGRIADVLQRVNRYAFAHDPSTSSRAFCWHVRRVHGVRRQRFRQRRKELFG